MDLNGILLSDCLALKWEKPRLLEDERVEIWFQDEMGVEGDLRPGEAFMLQ